MKIPAKYQCNGSTEYTAIDYNNGKFVRIRPQWKFENPYTICASLIYKPSDNLFFHLAISCSNEEGSYVIPKGLNLGKYSDGKGYFQRAKSTYKNQLKYAFGEMDAFYLTCVRKNRIISNGRILFNEVFNGIL